MDELLKVLIDKCGSCRFFEDCYISQLDRLKDEEYGQKKIEFLKKTRCAKYEARPAWRNL